MRFLAIIIISMITNFSLADTFRLNRTSITKNPFSCSNGGMIRLEDTRFSNIKKVTFSNKAQLPQNNYVRFWNSTDHYEGVMVSWMKFPIGEITDSNWPNEGRHTADMTINDVGGKLIMTIKPFNNTIRYFSELSCSQQ